MACKVHAEKGHMRAGDTALPYTRKSLEALADTLKIHSSMVWLDPVTGNVSLKQLNLSEHSEMDEEEEE